MAGGCGWIGVAIPLDRQVWALVNQPVLNFSSLPTAWGYWLGSMVLPLLTALLLLTLRPRKPSVVGQITVVQTIWWIAMVAGIWLPLLDPADGHFSRWLLLQHFQSAWVWSVPASATALAILASFRLLEIARRSRSNLGRRARVTIIVVHLILPVVVWLCFVSRVGGLPPLRPLLGLAAAATAVVAIGSFRYPPPYPRPLLGPSRGAVIALGVGALLSLSMLWVMGRPLPQGRARGVLWGAPGSFNNIRPWIEPETRLTAGAEHD